MQPLGAVPLRWKQGLYVHSLSRSTDLRQKEGTKSTDAEPFEPFQASSAAQGGNSSLMDSMLLRSRGAAAPGGQPMKSRDVCRT